MIGGERVAELVAEHPEELVLAPAGLAEFLLDALPLGDVARDDGEQPLCRERRPRSPRLRSEHARPWCGPHRAPARAAPGSGRADGPAAASDEVQAGYERVSRCSSGSAAEHPNICCADRLNSTISIRCVAHEDGVHRRADDARETQLGIERACARFGSARRRGRPRPPGIPGSRTTWGRNHGSPTAGRGSQPPGPQRPVTRRAGMFRPSAFIRSYSSRPARRPGSRRSRRASCDRTASCTLPSPHPPSPATSHLVSRPLQPVALEHGDAGSSSTTRMHVCCCASGTRADPGNRLTQDATRGIRQVIEVIGRLDDEVAYAGAHRFDHRGVVARRR